MARFLPGRRSEERVVGRESCRRVLMRSILPSRLFIDCALAPLAFSPTAAYSLPSGPKSSAPPLWFVALLRLLSSRMTTSLPGDGDVAVGRESADAVVNGWASSRCSRRRRSDSWRSPDRRRRRAGPRSPDGADGQCKKGSRQQHAVLDDAQPAALLADEEPAVGRELHRGRARETAGDERFSESRAAPSPPALAVRQAWRPTRRQVRWEHDVLEVRHAGFSFRALRGSPRVTNAVRSRLPGRSAAKRTTWTVCNAEG